MIYKVGIEDIEPNHWVAWSFDRPGLTGKGSTQVAALAHLQTLLPDGEIHVVEEFRAYPSPQNPEPDYLVNAFFEDDRRRLTEAEIHTALNELTVSGVTFFLSLSRCRRIFWLPNLRRGLWLNHRHCPPRRRGRVVVLSASGRYCSMGALPGDALAALAAARADTAFFSQCLWAIPAL